MFINSTPSLPPVAPYFFPPPSRVEVKTASQLDKDYTGRYKEYVFPEILDLNVNDTYEISVTGLKNWMSFDNTKGKENLKFD